jgi:hypothetical protein
MYQRGRKATVVEYKETGIPGQKVFVFRDINESSAEQTNYLRHMANGDKAYTGGEIRENERFHGDDSVADKLDETDASGSIRTL